MNLTLREIAALRDGQVYGTGRPVQCEVEGLPSGNRAMIANFGGPQKAKWQVMRIKNDVSGGWTGDYPSVEEALAALTAEYEHSR